MNSFNSSIKTVFLEHVVSYGLAAAVSKLAIVACILEMALGHQSHIPREDYIEESGFHPVRQLSTCFKSLQLTLPEVY